MSFSAHYLLAVLLTILSLPTLLWAQAVPQQPTKAPRASISALRSPPEPRSHEHPRCPPNPSQLPPQR